MKKTKIKFVGFWEGWNPNDNFIINTLREFCIPILSEEPDILFSSCFSDEYMQYDCIRVFYTGENCCPNFNEFDYAIGFENLNFGDRYLRYPLYLVDELYGEDYNLMKNKHLQNGTILDEKADFCSFVVSNGSSMADDARTAFFNKLSEYKKVNSGGRYLNNIGMPDGVEDKLAFQRKHKFSIAFENSAHPGYITEKIIQAFAADTIPIYWGAVDIDQYFNPESFINCNRFNTFDNAIDFVRRVDSDDELYVKMISTPALIDEKHRDEYKEALYQFLQNIVMQSSVDAIRTNRTKYDKAYFNGLIEKNKAYVNSVRIGNRVVDGLYRIFGR